MYESPVRDRVRELKFMWVNVGRVAGKGLVEW